MNEAKKGTFYVVAFCLLMASGLIGVCAVFGLCAVIWGPKVIESGPPDRTQPYFWAVMILLAPFTLFAFAAGALLIVLPLAAWLRIPLLDRSDWRNIKSLYRFLRRARRGASEETKQTLGRQEARTPAPGRSRFSRTRQSLRRLAAVASLAATLFYWWCGAEHVCMAGHMQHPPYPAWEISNDVLWGSLLVVATVAGFLSDFRSKLTLAGLAAALTFSRLALGSGGGVFFPLEIVVASALALLSALNMVRPNVIETRLLHSARPSSRAQFGRNLYAVLWLMPTIAIGVVFWGIVALAYFVPAMLYQRAVASDDAQTIARLASWGLGVDWCDAIGQTPLHRAAILRKTEMCRVLIANGADVNARDNFGDTPLHWAHSAEVARVLIENGADLNAKNEIEDTPLHSARSAQIAEVLIAAGANVNAKNRFCRTPLNTADGDDMKRALVLAGSEAVNSDKFGSTPIHDAARWDEPEVVELLLSRCAMVDARDGDQATPLHYAASRGHTGVVRLLLSHGADPEAVNAHGETPRALAEKGGHQEVVDLLAIAGTADDRE